MGEKELLSGIKETGEGVTLDVVRLVCDLLCR